MTYQKPRVLITDDEPKLDDVDVVLARFKEWEQRLQTMAKLIAGHLAFPVMDNDPDNVRIVVGDNYFACDRTKYPTPELLAQVTLAIEAGEANMESCNIPDFGPVDLQRFMPGAHVMDESESLTELFEYNINAEVRKLRKGLRP